MIVDRFDNWNLYPLGPAWRRAFEFLRALGPDAEEREYPLQGSAIYARVMSYDTRPREEGKLEAHRRFLDIQAVVTGAEAIEWVPVADVEGRTDGGLAIATPYDAAKDVAFYAVPAGPLTRVELRPGLFMALFAEDAHMPQLALGPSPTRVKKVVVKVALDLLARD